METNSGIFMWLSRYKDDDDFTAFCKACSSKLQSRLASIKLHANTEKHKSNLKKFKDIQSSESWARYCYPNAAWSSLEFQTKLYSSHRMLCDKHFEETSFLNFEEKKLHRDAVPEKDWSKMPTKSSLLREHDYAASPEINAETLPPKVVKVTTSCPALPTTDVSVSKPAGQEILEWASTKQTRPEMGIRNDTLTNPTNESHDQMPTNKQQKPSQPVSDDQDLDNMNTTACDELFDDENTLTCCDNVILTDNWDFGFLKDINETTKVDILQDHNKNNETSNSDTNVKIEQENGELLVLGGDDDDIVAEIDNDDDDFVMNLMASKIEGTDNCGECDDEEHYVPQQHQGVCCNVCLGDIVGFRYRCCECEDYDMCSDCESRQQHPQHYVLRVPGCRKQSEIRRVMAAVHLSLVLPPDVKDEPTIKIEDPIEEQPPDPLHTDEPESSPPRPAATHMETDNLMTDPSTSLDPQTTLDHLTSCKPEKSTIQDKPLRIKLIGRKSDIPVMLDALHRKAIVQLKQLMQKPAAKECTPTAPVLDIEKQAIKQITRKRKLGPKKRITDFSPYLHSLQDREKTKEIIGRKLPIILRAKQLKQKITNESVTQRLFASPSSEKKKDDDIVPFQNIASDRKGGASVIQTEEKMFKVVLAGGSSILKNTEKVYKKVPTDYSCFVQAKKKLFKIVPAVHTNVAQNKEKFNKMISTDSSRMVLSDGSAEMKNLQNSNNR